MVPRSVSAVASTAAPDGLDELDGAELDPDEELPAAPALPSSDPQPASRTAPTARTVLRIDVVRMGAPSIVAARPAQAPVRKARILGAEGSAARPPDGRHSPGREPRLTRPGVQVLRPRGRMRT